MAIHSSLTGFCTLPLIISCVEVLGKCGEARSRDYKWMKKKFKTDSEPKIIDEKSFTTHLDAVDLELAETPKGLQDHLENRIIGGAQQTSSD
jgi:hypothetical protein